LTLRKKASPKSGPHCEEADEQLILGAATG